MIDKKTCAVSGHRPNSFPFLINNESLEWKKYIEKLTNEIEMLIHKCGYNHFISGMAEGVDLDFAKIVIELRDQYHNHITLECAIPYKNQSVSYSEENKKIYQEILKKADFVTYISKNYFNGCLLKRNRYIVDASNFLVAVWNGQKKGGTFYTMKYAKLKNKQIQIIKLGNI